MKLISTRLENLKQALDNFAIISTTDKNGTITYVNEMFCKVSKYSKEELIGQNHRILKSGFHPPEFYVDLWKTISSGKIWSKVIKNKAKDGSYYWVKTIIMPVFDDKGNIEEYISIRTDITNEIELQEQILQKERLTSIGELSARLAHDLRNPLSILKNAVGILKLHEPNLSQTSIENLKRMNRAIARMTHQIDEVLDFVKPKQLLLSKITLLDILNTTLERAVVPDYIDLYLPPHDITMIGDAEKLAIVFSNLISNAIQAMKNRGRIDISAVEEADKIVIEVRDTGEGIPSHIMPKIFDPLFTTRQTGSGLGLVSCKSIIERHDGTIDVKSTVGGSTVIITLPKHSEDV